MSYERHVAFCERNNYYCEQCDIVIQAKEKDKHIEERHSLYQCECGDEIEMYQLEHHLKKQCMQRIIKCPYCKIEKKYIDMVEHYNYCKTKTRECRYCKQFITYKSIHNQLGS